MPRSDQIALLFGWANGQRTLWEDGPVNTGVWRFLRGIFGDRRFDRLPLAGIYRQSAAGPAIRSSSGHRLEQE